MELSGVRPAGAAQNRTSTLRRSRTIDPGLPASEFHLHSPSLPLLGCGSANSPPPPGSAIECPADVLKSVLAPSSSKMMSRRVEARSLVGEPSHRTFSRGPVRKSTPTVFLPLFGETRLSFPRRRSAGASTTSPYTRGPAGHQPKDPDQ